MARKEETPLQERIQKVIRRRGGYVPVKSHGNMITPGGISDLRFCYKGQAVHLEVKTEIDKTEVSVKQGIHCRAAQKAGGITMIVWNTTQVEYLLNLIDEYVNNKPAFHDWLKVNKKEVWDDGTTY